MAFQALVSEAAPTAVDADGDLLVQWLLRIWAATLVTSFLVGALCWKQCGSRLCQMKVGQGERSIPVTDRATQPSETFFPAPPLSEGGVADPIRRRPSASSKGRRLLEVIESMANGQLSSPWSTRRD